MSEQRGDGPRVSGWRRLHSLSGVFPVGLFMLVQLAAHAKALQGPGPYHASLEAIAIWPWTILVLVPLLFHAVYGLKLSLTSRYNVGRYPTSGNWMYVLQRVSGMLAMAFLLLHGVLFWLPQLRGELASDQLYHRLAAQLSATYASVPLLGLAYLIGLGACTFHLAGGLWSFAARWGLTVSRSGRNRLGAALALAGMAMFAVSANTVIHFASGRALLGTRDIPAAVGGACMDGE